VAIGQQNNTRGAARPDSKRQEVSQQLRAAALVFSPVPMKTRNKGRAHNRATRTTDSPLRIVSLAPSATSILCAIGARRALVGVTKWCADVADVDGLPQLGDCWRLESVDEILALRPTLVIGSVPFKQETVAKLLEQPLNFLAKNPRSLADIERDILLLGRIAGRVSASQRLIARMRREFASIRRKAAVRKQRARVYCEAWPNPRISSPPWVAELVAIAGGQSIVPPGEKVTDEQVAAAHPDVIVLAWAATAAKADAQKAYDIAAWKDAPAILNRQVHVISDELLNTPGPPLLHGTRALFRILSELNKER
jgi:iron complex transport system substrate-binding protein